MLAYWCDFDRLALYQRRVIHLSTNVGYGCSEGARGEPQRWHLGINYKRARGDVDDRGTHLELGVARILAAASTFCWRRSASRTRLLALTRRVIA